MSPDTSLLRPETTQRQTAVGHMVGLAVVVAGLGMIAAAAVEFIDGGSDVLPLGASGVFTALPALALWRRTTPPGRLPHATIFSAVLASWLALSLVGTIPYLATAAIPRFDNALFESISGFTTTGATILRPIEGLGAGILFWRSLTQWFGGMGVIVLAVAVLPFLGVGGLNLIQAEAPGPSSERLAPRVRETARRLWILYLGFTVIMATAYAAAGMSAYDAVVHAFTTVSTGGFSPYDDSMLHFASPTIEWIAVGGMFLAGGNFAIYYRVLRGKPLAVFRSIEFVAYGAIVAGIAGAAIIANGWTGDFDHTTIRGSVFSVAALTSTTGFTTVDFVGWSSAIQLLLLFCIGVGGMTGSTAGGFKVFRVLAVLSYARRQSIQQLHPRIVKVVRLGDQVIPDEVVHRIVGFFGLFMAIGALATFVVAATGTDMVTSISAAASSIGNVGPGLGDVGPTGHWTTLAAPARMFLALVMLVGRLEVFPVLLGVVPALRVISDRLPARVSKIGLRIFRG